MNEKAYGLGTRRSVIRELYEYGKIRAEQYGADEVFDFSLGNPSVPAPEAVGRTIERLLKELPPETLHGYTSAQGDKGCRERLAEKLNARFTARFSGEKIYFTCGAAASLTVTLNALCERGDEVVLLAPYFTEYTVFVEGAGARAKIVKADENLLPDFTALENALTDKVRAVIVNTPNNPSGVVYGKETLAALAALLRNKSKEYGRCIYLISDEPYRELVYGDAPAPMPVDYYENTVVCYSYSKSLSLAGERIGYIAVPDGTAEGDELYAAILGAGRMLGFVCAPALFQRVAAECDGLTGDLSVYRQNRDLLYEGLTALGYECVYPEGAFYLLMKTLEPNANAFCERAKAYGLLLVPSDGFGVEGYVRIAYCVPTERIKRALPYFERLKAEY